MKEVAPRGRGEGFAFAERVHGGAVPKQYFSSVEAGCHDALAHGPLGFPVVDVEAVLSDLAASKGGGGNWRTSIVDLLKLLDLDSSLAARKELAEELNVHAGEHGSAEQNIALSKAVWNGARAR